MVPTSAAYGQITTDAPMIAEAAQTKGSSNTMNTEAMVRSYFKDIPVMIQIARCESTFQHKLADGSTIKGRVDPADTGVMQINKRYHQKAAATMGLNLEDIYHNMAYARFLYERQGTQPWNASAPCWAKTLAINN